MVPANAGNPSHCYHRHNRRSGLNQSADFVASTVRNDSDDNRERSVGHTRGPATGVLAAANRHFRPIIRFLWRMSHPQTSNHSLELSRHPVASIIAVTDCRIDTERPCKSGWPRFRTGSSGSKSDGAPPSRSAWRSDRLILSRSRKSANGHPFDTVVMADAAVMLSRRF